MWKIEQLPVKLSNGDTTWFAMLKTNDGINIRVQVGYQASHERAMIIVQQMAGIITHSEEP